MKRIVEFVLGFFGEVIVFAAWAGCVMAVLAVHQALAVLVGYALFVPMLIAVGWCFGYAVEGKAETDKATAKLAKRWRELYAVTAPFAALILVGSLRTEPHPTGTLVDIVMMAIAVVFMVYGPWAFMFMIGGREQANAFFRFSIRAFRDFPYAVLWLVRRIVRGPREQGQEDWLDVRLFGKSEERQQEEP